MTACTWRGCSSEGPYTQLDDKGRPWAHLCPKHAGGLSAAVRAGNQGRVMRVFVMAQGGHEQAFERLREN
jgi:hypothetical protein